MMNIRKVRMEMKAGLLARKGKEKDTLHFRRACMAQRKKSGAGIYLQYHSLYTV